MRKITNGVIPGLHFDKFQSNVLAPLGLKDVEVEQKDNGLLITVSNPEMSAIKRIVYISEIDYSGKFRVEFKEVVVEFDFTTYTTAFEIDTNYERGAPHYQETPTTMSYFYGRAMTFLKEKFEEKRIPPAELIEKRDHINKEWLSDIKAQVVLYSYNGYGEDWRFKVVHKAGTVIVAHLSTSVLGHTLSMFVYSATDAFKRGLVEGRLAYAEEVASEAFKRAFNGIPEHTAREYAPEAFNLLKTGTLRKATEVI